MKPIFYVQEMLSREPTISVSQLRAILKLAVSFSSRNFFIYLIRNQIQTYWHELIAPQLKKKINEKQMFEFYSFIFYYGVIIKMLSYLTGFIPFNGEIRIIINILNKKRMTLQCVKSVVEVSMT